MTLHMKRGLFRLWLVGAVLWELYAFLALRLNWVNIHSDFEAIAWLIAPPVVAPILYLAAQWVLQGFKPEPVEAQPLHGIATETGQPHPRAHNGNCPSGSNFAGSGYCRSSPNLQFVPAHSGNCPSGTHFAGSGYCAVKR